MPPKDVYVNKAFIRVLESAADTLTFQKLEFGTSIFEKRALIIHRVTYTFRPADLVNLVAAEDLLNAALTMSNKLSSITQNDVNVVDLMEIRYNLRGTAADFQIDTVPIIRDFSTFPGGGLIVPAAPIYGAVQGVSTGAASQVDIIVYFTMKTLSADEYWELVEATRLIQ